MPFGLLIEIIVKRFGYGLRREELRDRQPVQTLELDLNERQLTEIERILEADLPPISDLSDQMARARRDFIAGTEPDEFDADAVRRFAVTQAPLYVEMVTLTASLKAEVMGVLNPVQQARLGELLGLFDPVRS